MRHEPCRLERAFASRCRHLKIVATGQPVASSCYGGVGPPNFSTPNRVKWTRHAVDRASNSHCAACLWLSDVMSREAADRNGKALADAYGADAFGIGVAISAESKFRNSTDNASSCAERRASAQ
jgi:hypothetical protein